ncbi:MAG: aminodeoxychorismate synthase component I [Gammaproteobacteria bacterium]|nr:aminodeoxychorismate synthase component I [Gammaproteobacteria bacterium]
MKIAELPYRRNSAELFEAICGEPWSIFLDSGYPLIDSGRYDILAARPYLTITTNGAATTIRGGGVSESPADPFALVREHLGDQAENRSGIPFCGGAMGYFAYDLGRRIEKLPARLARDVSLPDMAVGLYDWAVVVDHHMRRTWLVAQGRCPATERDWPGLERMFGAASQTRLPRYTVRGDILCNMTREDYAQAFGRICHYIREGDCYQVNLAQRFEIEVSGDPWDVYLDMRRHNPAPFAAFLRLPEGAVLSSSPERFLQVTNGNVETKPIKGTIRRSKFAYEDKALAAQLLESEKDRAENLMIVDLLRNDLGKNCRIGSVAVPKLFALESFANVHHLVSTVTGTLAEGRQALDLLRGCFPGGSITGAPKLRAMEIIEELEPHRRNVYCGAIGYVGFDGNMDTNIVIRTAITQGDRYLYWAGGGIVADSDLNGEYEESFAKAQAVLSLFGRGLARNVGS